MAMPWFRMWNEAINDPKFRRIARMSGQPLATVLATWWALLSDASANDEDRGAIKAYAGDVAVVIDADDEAVDSIIAAMTERGLIDEDGRIANWSKRQPSSDADSTRAERQRRHRERKRNALRTRDKRIGDASATVSATEVTRQDSDTDTDSDSDRSMELQPCPVASDADGVEEGSGLFGEPEPTRPTAPAVDLARACAAFWEAYPKRAGSANKAKSLEIFRRLVSRHKDPRTHAWKIVQGAKAYAANCEACGVVGTEKVAMASTWLNQARWTDEYRLPEQTSGTAGHPQGHHNSGARHLREAMDRLDQMEREGGPYDQID